MLIIFYHTLIFKTTIKIQKTMKNILILVQSVYIVYII